MPFGALFRNGNDETVISDEDPSMVFVGKATWHSDIGVSGNLKTLRRYKTPVCPTTPMIAVGNGTEPVGLWGITAVGDGSYYVDVFQTDAGNTYYWPNTCSTADVYCFVPADSLTASSATFGMRVFKANGDITFDSGFKQALRIETFVTVTPLSSGSTLNVSQGTWPTPQSFTSGIGSISKPAVIYSCTGWNRCIDFPVGPPAPLYYGYTVPGFYLNGSGSTLYYNWQQQLGFPWDQVSSSNETTFNTIVGIIDGAYYDNL